MSSVILTRVAYFLKEGHIELFDPLGTLMGPKENYLQILLKPQSEEMISIEV